MYLKEREREMLDLLLGNLIEKEGGGGGIMLKTADKLMMSVGKWAL